MDLKQHHFTNQKHQNISEKPSYFLKLANLVHAE